MRFAVVDDDKYFLKYFYKLMISYIKNAEVDFYDSPLTFLNGISKNKKNYDALFLDIDMPSLNGIELSRKIYKNINKNCVIIFITNKKEMVYDAFGMNVLAFIYKPDFAKKIKQVFESLYAILEYDKSVMISTISGKCKVKLKDIFYIEKDMRKVQVCVNGDEKFYTNYRNLVDLEKIIQHPYFVYINRSMRINLFHVNKITNDIIYLDNGEHFFISKSKVKEISALFVDSNSNL